MSKLNIVFIILLCLAIAGAFYFVGEHKGKTKNAGIQKMTQAKEGFTEFDFEQSSFILFDGER